MTANTFKTISVWVYRVCSWRTKGFNNISTIFHLPSKSSKIPKTIFLAILLTLRGKKFDGRWKINRATVESFSTPTEHI